MQQRKAGEREEIQKKEGEREREREGGGGEISTCAKTYPRSDFVGYLLIFGG